MPSAKTDLNHFKSFLNSTEGLILLTGAGMGVDSGLPTYRGKNGSYGQLTGERQGSIFEIMTPKYLEEHPVYMWERFFRRIREFRKIEPHRGFEVLKNWTQHYVRGNYFVLTSNIDSMFQKAGFAPEKIYELHGNIHQVQCARPCRTDWVAPYHLLFGVERERLTTSELPRCPHCGYLLRPNTYLFRDKSFVRLHTDAQRAAYFAFLEKQGGKRLLALEIGAGTHVQSIRMHTRRLMRQFPDLLVVRINPDYPEIREPHLSLPMGAQAALDLLNAASAP